MEWTNELVLDFLDAFETEPCIWNPKHAMYKNRDEVSEAWHRIKASLNFDCTVSDLKKKRESLMASFRMLLNKKKKCTESGVGTEESLKPKWFAYGRMEKFLASVYHLNDSISIEATTTNAELLEPKLEIDDYEQPTKEEINSKTEEPQIRHMSEGKQIAVKNILEEATKRKSNDNDSHRVKKRMDEGYNFLEEVMVPREKDECDLYTELLARKLRKFDELQREIVMNQIDNLIFQRRIQSLKVMSSSNTQLTPNLSDFCFNSPSISSQPSPLSPPEVQNTENSRNSSEMNSIEIVPKY